MNQTSVVALVVCLSIVAIVAIAGGSGDVEVAQQAIEALASLVKR